MNDSRRRRSASGGGSPARSSASVAVVAFLAAVAVIAVACGGPPSAAGLVSESPSALESGLTASPSAVGSVLPSASAASKPSPKPTKRPTPAPTPNTKSAITSYQIPSIVNCGGYAYAVQIQITWIVKRATGVTISIDGPGIFERYPGSTGLATVPFACGVGDTKHTYTITTTGGPGSAVHLTKTVRRIG